MADLIKALVDRNREHLVKRLPSYLSPEQFFLLCYQLDRNDKLARIAQKNPDSILAQILKAADCGLVVGDAFGHAYIIGYGDEAQFQVGWRGFVYQWERAGAVLKVDANVVYDGDDIEVEAGDNPGIRHKPNIMDPRRADMKWMTNEKNILASYAIGWLPIAPLKAEVFVLKGLIDLARSCSPMKDGVPWTKFYHQMARKTAVRRLEGLIQMCGPTEQNREAWDRYARTIELDRASFRIEPVDDDHDDLPGVPAGKPAPKSGATVEHGSAERGTSTIPPPASEGRRRPSSAASTPPSLKLTAQSEAQATRAEAKLPLEPPEDNDPISDEMQDQLITQGGMAGLPPSKLRKYVAERYNVGDLAELTKAQSLQLSADLKRQAANK
jgi:recombination protein RecT